MSKDDFEVVAYKVLSYLYACLKAGAVPSEAKALEVSRVGEVYFYAVLSSLQSKGLVEPIRELRDMNGDVVAIAGTLSITMDGAAYLKENGAMRRVGRFLGAAGSSPHARGARVDDLGAVGDLGIIPACAGSTGVLHRILYMVWDHPRMRGEHDGTEFGGIVDAESSPHARGALCRCLEQHVGVGIIPACAGSTYLFLC